jgi:hypothetical protein
LPGKVIEINSYFWLLASSSGYSEIEILVASEVTMLII